MTWRDDYDTHYQPFDPGALIGEIRKARKRFPKCWIGRSGNGIGNLVVYTEDGEYVGLIECNDPPKFIDFTTIEEE